jgi:chromosome segregation ATPase
MRGLSFRWKSHPGAAQLKQAIDQLRAANVQLRRQLTTKTNLANGLQLALAERCARIDDLNAKLEQARVQNRKLDEENEHLATMIRILPQLDAML